MTLPSYLQCPNPSKPVDNLKAEGPSPSLYSIDTHNESKKAEGPSFPLYSFFLFPVNIDDAMDAIFCA